MKVAVMTGLFAVRDMDVNAGHSLDTLMWRFADVLMRDFLSAN
jgi:hypothetical protein